MAVGDDPEWDALLRASATIDDLMEMHRVRKASSAGAAYRVDTLSRSLANPFGTQVEITLINARGAIQDDGDRAVLVAAARGFHEKKQISDDALGRILSALGIQ